MRIGIDCRMAGTGEGIARYVEELVRYLAIVDSTNEYYLLIDSRANPKFEIRNSKFVLIEVNSPYYSLAEQTRFIWELERLRLDLLHFPSFNVPMLYPGKFIVTIHDLIHHRFPGKKKGRFFHRLAYRAVMNSAVRRARKIIAVSESTKQDLLSTFKISPEKVEVIYEGVDDKFRQTAPQPLLVGPYLLFVGVWRQYKNLPRLARAFDILKERRATDLKLVLAGKIDPFYPEIKTAVFSIKHAQDIKALSYVPDDELVALYGGAQVLVLPSLIEGFGLIGVEAQAAGTPVAASDIPVLREILGDGAVYFNPESETDIAEKINEVLADSNLRNELKNRARKNSERFDWGKTAEQTLQIYEPR